MSAAAEKMVRRLKLSGLHGFDFMLEASTGNARLIEINPRATQVGHLTLGPGRDLPAALYAALSGEDLHPAPKVTENDIIALFPQEWMRDPDSAFLAIGLSRCSLGRTRVASCLCPRSSGSRVPGLPSKVRSRRFRQFAFHAYDTSSKSSCRARWLGQSDAGVFLRALPSVSPCLRSCARHGKETTSSHEIWRDFGGRRGLH